MSTDFYFVGLGNPGPGYAPTRHNIGFLLVDRLLAAAADVEKTKPPVLAKLAECWKGQLDGRHVVFVKPTTFMNNSGDAVAALLKIFPMDISSQLILAYDELDLPAGSVRLRLKGSAGTHRGMESVIAAVGHGNFPRIRLGIGPKPAAAKAEDFVLAPFKREERDLAESALVKAEELFRAVLKHGWDLAVSKYQPAILGGPEQ
ncbi:MAG: aminoacyl-tRNA hydrolase [Elusimicrobia bacterium]|nr:aminoacyl-tRNA hydrolase [Elusimicrobiota bacterium]